MIMSGAMMDTRSCVTQEEIENARIARRRAEWKVLRGRLLNPNVRMTGRDETALAAQIAEKKMREEEERLDDRRYAEFVANVTNMLRESDINAADAKSAERAALKATWAQQLAEREAEAMNVPEDEPVGVSSCQIFDGEDPAAAKRRAVQHAQMRKWTKAQKEAKLQREREEREQDQAYGAHVLATVDKLDLIERDAANAAKDRRKQLQAENIMLAQQKSAAAARYVAEAKNGLFPLLDAALMDESKGRGQSVVPGRYRTDHYKGMEKEEQLAIRKFQMQQILEKQRRQQDEKQAEMEWANSRARILNVAENVSMQELDAQRKHNYDVAASNAILREELRSRRAADEQKRNQDPAFTAEFFKSFGTSHR